MAFDFVHREVLMDNIPEHVPEAENTSAVSKNSKRLEITMDDFIQILRTNKKLYCISSFVAFEKR